MSRLSSDEPFVFKEIISFCFFEFRELTLSEDFKYSACSCVEAVLELSDTILATLPVVSELFIFGYPTATAVVCLVVTFVLRL